MIVGIDARPALFGHTGFGRVVRESLRALGGRTDLELRCYGASWRRTTPGLELPANVAQSLRAPRLPARLQHALAPLGFDVESVLGKVDLFHHTDLVFAPVRRAPEVLTIYDLVYLESREWHDPGFAARVEPRVRARAAAAHTVIVPCERVADAVLRFDVAPADRVHVLPLGCDHLSLDTLPDEDQRVAQLVAQAGLELSHDQALVLVPGTREPRKNQLALLSAFERLPAALHARLLLVGGVGWGCRELERRLARRDGRVASVGAVSDADWGALLRRAQVVAYPSFAEGFGLPVFEALAQACVVLSSHDTPMADLAGEALQLVDPRDPDALARELQRALCDDERRAELAAAGPRVSAAFTWAAHADGLQRVYAATLS
ncbi:MAG: glycosyl transferase family 1 [Planctomycetota bacterium]|nr:MAG: glycosyl transferase family 1 [Planctomycetota bacterium]